MLKPLKTAYTQLIINRPLIPLAIVIVAMLAAAWYAPRFRLDASADSLVLESDRDLDYYADIRDDYGSDDFLVITFEPNADTGPLFGDASIATIQALAADLEAIPAVSSTTSILNVPLLQSPPMSFSEIQAGTRTLLDPDTDRELAAEEFANSPLYRNLLTDPDATVTAMLANLKPNTELAAASDAREQARQQHAAGTLSDAALADAEAAYLAASAAAQTRSAETVQAVRDVVDQYRDRGTINLGGVSMVAADMVSFVQSDLSLFSWIVGLLLLVLLAVAFRRPRWVIVPSLICVAVVLAMVGVIGYTQWPVTVVSSNFTALILIITLALVVHLVVRHIELQQENPAATQQALLQGTIDSKFAPSVYTSLTTMVSFGSLMLADVRPVIDFGVMMVWGVLIALVITFLLYPGALGFMKAGTAPAAGRDVTASITNGFANLVKQRSKTLLVAYLGLAVLAAVGISRLGVENRFIDYFKESTEIYKGLVLIDKKLGGTTPLEVVLEPTQRFIDEQNAPEPEAEEEDLGFGDDFGFDFGDDDADGGITGTSYWYNTFELERVAAIHDYLDSLDETGKVLSIHTTLEVMTILNDGKPLDNITLAVIHNRLPDDVKAQLVDPYMSEDGNQLRFSIRVIDSDANLKRDELLKKIRSDLIEQFDLEPEQVRLTGLLVLYNNVLQSLFSSQIMTLGVVFLVIGLMLAALFRSLKLAIVGILPTAFAAACILGLMGWIGISLDIMTITIAAIVIGIGVDNTIHYTHRFTEEIAKPDIDRWEAMRIAHGSVGRAIFYTSITVTLGFSILALSSFKPIIYFGLLTGLAMVLALIANLTLLPLLLVKTRIGDTGR